MSVREIVRPVASPVAAAAILAALVAAPPAYAQFPDVLSESECPGCRSALEQADERFASLVAPFTGTWSSALTSAADPAWAVEDFSCFIACTPEARALAAARFGPPTGERRAEFQLFQFACDPRGFAAQVVSPLPLRIEREPGRIVMHYEEFGAERTIPLDGPRAAATGQPSLLGVSVGRFEGSALVIETSGIAARRFYAWFGGRALSDKLRAKERYTTSPDGVWLDLVLELDDPETHAAPPVLTKRWRRVPGVELAHYGCDVMSGQLDGVFAEYANPSTVEERRLVSGSPQLTAVPHRPREE
jgi:hypothetical protein